MLSYSRTGHLGFVIRIVVLLLLAALFSITTATAAFAQGYTLVPIFEVETSELARVQQNLRLPAINDTGMVAFQADLHVPGPGDIVNGYAIYRGDARNGPTAETVFSTYNASADGLSGLGEQNLAIDRQGRVVFFALTSVPCGAGIFAERKGLYIAGGPEGLMRITEICHRAPENIYPLTFRGATIRSDGVVIFAAEQDIVQTVQRGLFAWSASHPLQYVQLFDDQGNQASLPSVNSSGQVAFMMASANWRLDGGATTRISDLFGSENGGSQPVVANNGSVAFYGAPYNGGILSPTGIYQGLDLATLQLIVSSQTPPFLIPVFLGPPALNNDGIAFFGFHQTTGQGIYYRSNAGVLTKIIAVDDPLPGFSGFTVQSLRGGQAIGHMDPYGHRPGMNARGQIAFVAIISDGTATKEVVVRADPSGLNRPPTITSPCASAIPPVVTCIVEARQGEPYSLRINASDPDGDTLTYTWAGDGALGVPVGLSLSAGGEISGMPPIAGANVVSYPVTVTVDDGHGETSATSFLIRVLPQAPAARSFFQAQGILASAADAPYVFLTWDNPNPETAQNYTIERLDPAGVWRPIVLEAPVTWSAGQRAVFEDRGPQIVEGGSYQYRLRAGNVGGQSPWISPTPNPVTVPVALRVFKHDAIPGVDVTSLTDGFIFRWVTNLPSSARVDIKLGNNLAATANSQSSDGINYTATVHGLLSNTAYDYVVTVKSAPACEGIDCVIVTGQATTTTSSIFGHSLVLRVERVTVQIPPAQRISSEDIYRVDVDAVITNTGNERIEAPMMLSGARLFLPCPIRDQSECGSTFLSYPRPTGDFRGQISIAPSTLSGLNPMESSPRVTVSFYVDDFIRGDGRPSAIWGSVAVTANYNAVDGPREEQPSANLNLNGTGADLQLSIVPTASSSGAPLDRISVSVYNHGPSDLDDVTLSIQLPAGFVPGPVDFGPRTTQCRLTPGNRINCTLTLRARTSVLDNITLTPGPAGPAPLVWGFVSSAAISDPDLVNNLAVATFLNGNAVSLRLEGISAIRDPNPPQRSTTFAFRVINGGTVIAHHLAVRAEGDLANITQLCVTSCATWTGAPRGLNIDLPPGASMLINVVANVSPSDIGRVALIVGSDEPTPPFHGDNGNQLSVFPVR